MPSSADHLKDTRREDPIFSNQVWQDLEKKVLQKEGEVTQLDEQLLQRAQEIRDSVKKRDLAFLVSLFSLVFPSEDATQAPELLYQKLASIKEFGLPATFQAVRLEILFATIRSKAFDATLISLLSPDALLKLQQAIIEQDESVSNYFQSTEFGTAAAELRNNETGLLSEAEVVALGQLNSFLQTKGESVFHELFALDDTNNSTGVLFLLQKKRLEKIFKLDSGYVEPDAIPARQTMIESALQHIKAVTSKVWQMTNSPVATLIASTHDFFKHSLSTDGRPQVELGLHEVGSSIVGSQVLKVVVASLHEQFPEDISEVCITAIEKFSKKAVSVHGEFEFPYVMSMKNPLYLQSLLDQYTESMPGGYIKVNRPVRMKKVAHLRQLFSSVYPVTENSQTIGLTENGVNDEELRQNTMAVSMVDELEGARPRSFAKYNEETPTERVVSNPSLAHYIAYHTLQSVTGCFELNLLKKLEWQDLEEIKELKLKASLLLLLSIDASEPELKLKPQERLQLLYPLLSGAERYEGYYEDRVLLLPKKISFYVKQRKIRDLYEQMNQIKTVFNQLKQAIPTEQIIFRKDFNQLMKNLMQKLEELTLPELLQNMQIRRRLELAWTGLETITFFNVD